MPHARTAIGREGDVRVDQQNVLQHLVHGEVRARAALRPELDQQVGEMHPFLLRRLGERLAGIGW